MSPLTCNLPERDLISSRKSCCFFFLLSCALCLFVIMSVLSRVGGLFFANSTSAFHCCCCKRQKYVKVVCASKWTLHGLSLQQEQQLNPKSCRPARYILCPESSPMVYYFPLCIRRTNVQPSMIGQF